MIAERVAWDAEGDIELWRFPCEQEIDGASLDDAERARAARFVSRVHRARYVAQHAVMRALLARYTGAAPVFRRGEHGKPYLVAGGVTFNLSHCDDVGLLTVSPSGAEVGCDVERLDARVEPAELAKRVLAPGEAGLVARPEFFRVWCRKEACLKAVGVGLVDDLPSIDVRGDVVAVCGARVCVRDVWLDADHAAAVAWVARQVSS